MRNEYQTILNSKNDEIQLSLVHSSLGPNDTMEEYGRLHCYPIRQTKDDGLIEWIYSDDFKNFMIPRGFMSPKVTIKGLAIGKSFFGMCDFKMYSVVKQTNDTTFITESINVNQTMAQTNKL
ncbi:hypothetical protein A3Q56_08336 [Intoshia linei]|uniref:Uncharacterized protein n=1 Tax=Intoshia linei TaxID=1819745 RepID=A0A177ARU6_9BILA|nr:hypothetical protein A3Q56_08336 [Intoshia linei]